MNNIGQIDIGGFEVEPVGLIGGLLVGCAAFYIQRTAHLGVVWNILALIVGFIAGYFVTGKIIGGGQ